MNYIVWPLAIIVVAISVGIVEYHRADTFSADLKVCTDSGGEWKRNFWGSRYKCVHHHHWGSH